MAVEATRLAHLLPHHAGLVVASAITPEVAEARGYRSVETRAELRRLGFGDAQCRVPALLIPVWSALGEIGTYQIRPDEPRIKDGKALKYEGIAGRRMVLDVHPFARDRLGDPTVPLWISEGVRKGDSAVSVGLCCVALLGVWTWRGTNDQGGKTALPDWEYVALNGRTVYLVFDSDVVTKPPVHAALARLKALLEARGATVLVVYLPAGEGGIKVGLDDYLAAGHTVDDLLVLAAPKLHRPADDGADADAPYAETPAGLVWRKPTHNGSVAVWLTNFTATIVGDLVEDDGVETRRLFDIVATIRGRPIHVTVPAAQFAGMAWVPDRLGAGAIVAPGMGLKDHARVAIQSLSGGIPERHIYAHTGWRLVDGAWVYLHAGGAIGADGAVMGVEVTLSGVLDHFRLPDPPLGEERLTAVRASLALVADLPSTVSIPLLGATYLAPLREALGEEGPDFVPWFHGPSGVFKTELIALAQGHYGDFSRQTLPASFTATANAVERMAFAAKDAVLAVDDYHPAGDQKEAQAMAQVAGRLVRGAGNAAGRARMRADTSLRAAYPPRCVPIVSGERLLEGHSTVARVFPVPVGPGSIDPDRLAAAQDRRAVYPQAMAAYLQYLAGHLKELRTTLLGRFWELRREAQQAGGHRREPGQIAHLVLALEIWLGFAVEIGAIELAERNRILTEAWQVLREHAREHGEAQGEEAPDRIFLRLLIDGFAGKRAYLEAKGGGAPADGARWGWEVTARTDRDGIHHDELRHTPVAALIGALDGEWLLLYPEATYQFVAGAARAAGRIFPIELKTLLKRLDEAGLIATEDGGRRRVVNAWIGQGSRRVIKLQRDAVEPPPSGQDGEYREGGEGAAPFRSTIPAGPSRTDAGPNDSGNGEGVGTTVATMDLPGIPSIPATPDQRTVPSRDDEEVVEWAAIL